MSSEGPESPFGKERMTHASHSRRDLAPVGKEKGLRGPTTTATPRALARNGSFTYSVRCVHSSTLFCIIHKRPASFAVSISPSWTDSECVIEHRD
jgi:hypothetical protein